MYTFLFDFYAQYGAILLPILIFGARILDVSIGTLRIVFLSRGMRILAPLCGFFEVIIWLVAISRLMTNLTSWVNYVAYAAGFAAGNYVGMYIENRLAMGLLSVMIISKEDASSLITELMENQFGVTQVDAHGVFGKVKILYLIIKRRNLEQVEAILKKHRPDAFSVVHDVRDASDGMFPADIQKVERRRKLFGGWRKDK